MPVTVTAKITKRDLVFIAPPRELVCIAATWLARQVPGSHGMSAGEQKALTG